MASFGHVALGLLAGRLHRGPAATPERRISWATMAAFAALALLPDADVILVALGAQDAGAVGHRGASHSLSVALGVGLLSALVARRRGWPVFRTALACTLAVASHAALDVLGHGGRGLPLLWPLSHARFESPWRIFPDAPRGLKLLSRPGLADLVTEFLLFLPATAYALWPRLAHRAGPARASPALSIVAGGMDAPTALAAAPRPAHAAEQDPPVRSSG